MNISDIANFGESGKLALSHAERMAGESGLEDIGAGPLFLGVAQLEDVNIRRQFQKAGVDIDEVSRKIKSDIKAGKSAAGHQLMLSPDAKKAVEAAKREAGTLGQDKVEAPHLLLGILEDESGLAVRALKSKGADPAKVAENLRAMLRKGEWQPGFYDGRKAVEQPGIDKTSGIVKDLGRDLTADAEQGKFDPIVGREDEILAIMKILTGRRKNNAILVGDAGVG
jgi:ATP-dependent Clp protease ATP-binding subunit ClpC